MRLIVQFGDKYLKWSTITDSPVSYLMTEAELRDYIQVEYGESGLIELPRRMARVAKFGTSGMGVTKESLTRFNRAGDGESHLDEAGIIERYTQKQQLEE